MKTLILIIGLFFFNVQVHGQKWKWKNGNAEMLRLENLGKNEKAIKVGERTLAFVISRYGAMSYEASTVMENLAANYVEIDNYKKAKPLLVNSIAYQLKINGETDIHQYYEK